LIFFAPLVYQTDNYQEEREYNMNANRQNRDNSVTKNFTTACVEQCRAVAARLALAKESLIAEFKESFQIQERLLQLAVNEAEALARETEYPHLLFPALALEKVRVAASWHERQEQIRRVDGSLAFAA
jgi:hypothetical protein